MATASPRNKRPDSVSAETIPDQPQTEVAEVMPVGMADRANGEIAIPSVRFSDDALRDISSFDDALALLAEQDIPVVAADQVLGNGFAVLADKSRLCGVRMLILSWQFNSGDNGVFVSANVVAQHDGMNQPAKYVVNDGSTGIRDQLKAYTDKTGRTGGLLVKRGLRRSDYTYDDPSTKEKKNATTFYLDLSA